MFHRATFRRYSKIEKLYETAAALGSTLPQPGIALWLLQRLDFSARWILFRLVIKRDVDECPQAELDTAGSAVSVVLNYAPIDPSTDIFSGRDVATKTTKTITVGKIRLL